MSKKEHSTIDNLQVLFEDNHLIVINKRPGDIVQGDKTGDQPLSDTVKVFIKKKYNKPGNVYLGVVHRLDRPTSGIVVFAKTSKALPRLNKMFAEQNKSYAHIKEVSESKKAILTYRTLKKLDRYFLLEVDLETGRHHQIRSQLTAIGCPIKGDLKYGFNRSNEDGSIHLHARKLRLMHPVKKEPLEIIAPPPNDPIWNACL